MPPLPITSQKPKSSSSSSTSSSDDSSSSNSNSSSSSDDSSDDDTDQSPRPSRPSSAASSVKSTRSTRSNPAVTPTTPKKSPKKQLKNVKKQTTPPATSTPTQPPPKSKLIKSGTVTNTRTIKPISTTQKKKPPLKKPTLTKLPTKPSPVPKTIRKLPGKSMATVGKKIITAKKKSLIIRTRSSCSSVNSSTEEEDCKLPTTTGKCSTDEEQVKKVAKRPVTRRQKLNKKTIPTTTFFNQSLLLAASKPMKTEIKKKRSSCSSSLSSNTSPSHSQTLQTPTKNKYLSLWDNSDSDDANNIQQAQNNLIRVPAKTSNKPITSLPTDYFDYYSPPSCPFPSCDSTGHLSGKYPTHNFLSCCPKYNGLTDSECETLNQQRSRRESERTRYKNILTTPGKKPPKQTTETKTWLNEIKDLKQSQSGIVTKYDDLLWKDALALAADSIEKEQNEGGINHNLIMMQNNVYRIATMAVAMGRFEMKCWCESPYPEPLSRNRRLFVCEFCLKPVMSGTVLRRHCAKCVWRHPPGDEIYRKERLSVWEVDGKKQKSYCQNLCLLAKCFLDHKTLYLDVDPFLFYVMTLADSQGCHIVGYFSKEKNSFLNYNVSCILTLPPYQRQGFGRLLIDFSYLLTRVEGKVGSPEKPLSDLGLISYRSYWKDACLRRLCACASREINIKDLSIELGVSTADLISTLQYLGMLKYWKGKHLVLKKQDVLEEYLERVRRRGIDMRIIDSSCLRWRPYQPNEDEQSSEENKS